MEGTINDSVRSLTIVYIIAAIIFIVINFIIAKKFENVAYIKGHTDVHAFAVCFFLGIIGYIYVAALPDRGSPNPVKNVQPKYSNRSVVASKYECNSVTVTDKTLAGRCMICKEYSETLKHCKIVKSTTVTEFPVCDSCIEKLKNTTRQ